MTQGRPSRSTPDRRGDRSATVVAAEESTHLLLADLRQHHARGTWVSEPGAGGGGMHSTGGENASRRRRTGSTGPCPMAVPTVCQRLRGRSGRMSPCWEPFYRVRSRRLSLILGAFLRIPLAS